MKSRKALSAICGVLVAIAMLTPGMATFAQSEISGKLTVMVWGTPTE